MKKAALNKRPLPAGTAIGLTGALVGAGLWLGLVLAGCSSSTAPQGGDPPEQSIAFSPLGQRLKMNLNDVQVFSASAQPAARLSAVWRRGGAVVGRDSIYTYIPAAVGIDTLTVLATVGDLQEPYFWVLEIQNEVSLLPPEVPNVSALPGPAPAEVAVSWTRVTGAAFPLVEYLVAFSFAGPINEDNWDQATLLGTYAAAGGQIGYTQTFNEADGMIPGEQAWFAVRVRDDRQQLSSLTVSIRHDITWPWYLGGYVTDDAGQPLLGVSVYSTEAGNTTNTDGRGYFIFDKPFRNIDSVAVTTSKWGGYRFTSHPVSVAGDTTLTGLVLVNDYPLAIDCLNIGFMGYLRYMSNTLGPEQTKLNTWGSFPLSVFIPASPAGALVDMEEASLQAMILWNREMKDFDPSGASEPDYFVRTADSLSADIVFLFESRLVPKYGETTILLPPGSGAELGTAVPQKMQIWINDTAALDLFTEVEGVALHELGHTVGLFKHSQCTFYDYLMKEAGGIGAIELPFPIHLDEMRAVRALRNLGSGTDMARFSSLNQAAGDLPPR